MFVEKAGSVRKICVRRAEEGARLRERECKKRFFCCVETTCLAAGEKVREHTIVRQERREEKEEEYTPAVAGIFGQYTSFTV